MVNFSIPDSIRVPDFVNAMKARNIILRGGPRFRAVTHYWITPERVEIVVDAVREFMAHGALSETSTATDRAVS
jgi:hypothetical protein